jgi:tetratricopeptide (TPR) repeat protein
MKATPTRLIVALLLALAATSASAKEAVVGMSERVFETMNEVQLLLDAEDYDTARNQLVELLERKLSDYERAHALNMIGYIWYQQDDIERAAQYYLEAYSLEELPVSMRISLLTTLGQINLVREDYVAAEDYLRKLLAMPDQLLPGNQVLLAAALMGQKRYRDALEPLKAAIASEEAGGNPPRENWLSMLGSVYYELNDYPSMRDVMAQLTELYPREQYLMNLAALHGQLGDQDRQLALIEAMLDDNRLEREANLRMVVNLFMGEDMPYKAATVLEREIEAGRMAADLNNLELLSQAWLLSSEPARAIAPLEKAAELSESGELYLRLARLHMDAYEWAEADAAARRALDKGGLRREGHAWLLRGMAAARLERFTDARKRFTRAAEYDETRNYASQWLGFIDAEVARAEALAGS